MSERLEPELLDQLRAVAARSAVVSTLSNGRPNWITSVGPEGVHLETEASRAKGTGPQLVPAWMLTAAYRHLRAHGELENTYLLSSEGLNVKRSSAVCALLSQLPQVKVVSSRPIKLRWESS